MDRYIVTGGAGFIGSALVRTLLQRGLQVEVIDNLATGSAANLEEVVDEIAFHEVDIRHYQAIAPLIAGARCVFHLAALPSVPKSILDPLPSHDVNINGTFNVLRACSEGKVGRYIFAASSSAYGDTEVLPKVETMPVNPLSPYAAQKVAGEQYASVWARCFGLDTVSLRFFNVYGPRQDPSSPYSGVLSIFMTCLIGRRSPTIFGDGEQSRDFTYVQDVADLIVKAARAGALPQRLYNAGNGGRYTLNETWALLQKIEGLDIPPNYAPPRPGDVRHSQADTTLAVRELGHAPRFSFEQGLRATLSWYRASLERKSKEQSEGVTLKS